MKRIVVIMCCMLLVPCAAKAKELALNDILASSARHYPKIQAALAEAEKKRSDIQAARGAFDMRLDSDVKTRPSGYYDGNTADTRLVKPLATMNAELYSGYRISNGDFPVYEGDFETQDAGETRVGVIFSLLRDRAIDKNRFAVLKADYGYQIAELDVLLTQISVQEKAQKAYGEWVAAGAMRRVYQELLSIAEQRQKILQEKVKRGAIAKIALVENEQNILKRRGMLNEADRYVTFAANNLSLYWRDDNGNPVIPSIMHMPAQLRFSFSEKRPALDAVAAGALRERPELRILSLQKAQQNAELKFGENMLKPKLDVGLEMSRDYGAGPRSLEQTTGIAAFKLSIPLQRETGLGMVNAARAALKKTELDQRLVADRLRVEMNNLITDIYLFKNNMDISAGEITLAQKMEKAERNLVDNGASNLFILNAREEKTAEARVKNIALNYKLFSILASFYAATIQLDRLGLGASRTGN